LVFCQPSSNCHLKVTHETMRINLKWLHFTASRCKIRIVKIKTTIKHCNSYRYEVKVREEGFFSGIPENEKKKPLTKQ